MGKPEVMIEGADSYDILAGLEKPMTYQEILEKITLNRSIELTSRIGNLEEKLQAVEWALQALAEKLRDGDKE